MIVEIFFISFVLLVLIFLCLSGRELEKSVKKWKRHTVQDYFKMDKILIRVRNNTKEIAELKEHLDIHVNIFSRHDERFQILYKVLQKLGEWILVYIYDTGISPPLMRKDLEKLLEKLDVGSASARESLDRQTEKKEVGFDGFLGSNEARKKYLNKASGGEKAGSDSSSLNHPKDVRDGTLNQNSKPPEPSEWYFKPSENKWYHVIVDLENRKIIIDGAEFSFCERVRDATRNEPREDDFDFIDSRVVVKREKIEFWRKELLNKTDEVLKSMREVLG